LIDQFDASLLNKSIICHKIILLMIYYILVLWDSLIYMWWKFVREWLCRSRFQEQLQYLSWMMCIYSAESQNQNQVNDASEARGMLM